MKRSVMVGLVVVLLASTAWGQLDLEGQDITDEELAEKLKGLSNLTVLGLSGTKVTPPGKGCQPD